MSLRLGLLVTVLACSVNGCFLFHRNKTTPQQELFEALNRGQGITPAVPPQEAIKKLSEMEPDEMQGQITIKPPNAGGTLLDLPQLTGHPAGNPAPSGAPQTPGESEQP